MAILLLPNTAGDSAASMTNAGAGVATASGYNNYDVIAGPRSKRWRSAAHNDWMRLGYVFAANTTVTHCVITRADWLLTQDTMRVRGIQRNSGGTWSAFSGFDLNPITSSNLLGLYSQDYVQAVAPSDLRGFGIECKTLGGGSEAAQVSKIFYSNAVEFASNPTASGWEYTEASFYPMWGYFPYYTEARSSLTWMALTDAEIAAFKAIPNLLAWPMYLYDEDADYWPWKLEHVVVEDYAITGNGLNRWKLDVSFRRLKHYDTEARYPEVAAAPDGGFDNLVMGWA